MGKIFIIALGHQIGVISDAETLGGIPEKSLLILDPFIRDLPYRHSIIEAIRNRRKTQEARILSAATSAARKKLYERARVLSKAWNQPSIDIEEIKKAIQDGKILFEDYTNYQMALRFLAGAIGVPFLPTRSSLGTDILNKWGFSKDLRKKDPKIPNKKVIVMNNPFDSWGDASKVVLLPAITPDVTIIHVQKADKQGTIRMKGLTFADVEQAKSSKYLIVTCEELVESDELRDDPDQNQIPFFYVDAVVHIPYGAYPTACYRYYDYDPIYLNEYRRYAQDDDLFKKYLDKFVYGVKDHQELLNVVGKERIEMIKADPRTGYAINLDRK